MHSFIINSTNFLHKNYIIRISNKSGSKKINFVSYQNLITEVKKNIVSNYLTSMSPCFGNWTDGSWYCEGLLCHLYEKKSKNKGLDISEYKSLIDEVSKNNSFVMDEFWFFVCLVHFTDPVSFNSLNFDYWDYSWIKTDNLSEMFKRNNMKDGMERFYQEGKEKNYILEVKKDKCLLNKAELFVLFLKALISIEESFKDYEISEFERFNQEKYVVKINGKDFNCYKNKIIFSDNDIMYFTQFNNLDEIAQLPRKQRAKSLYNQFMNNKKQSNNHHFIEAIPSKELTGRITAFYLKEILTNDDSKHFNDRLSSELERELTAKKYKEIYVSHQGNKTVGFFSDKIVQEISKINNDDFNTELEKYVDNVKHEHTAITYVKNKAKLLKKQSGLALMDAQNQIVKQLFDKDSISKIYKKIKEDIISTLMGNQHFIYSQEKDQNLVLYGKNHIGFYSMKEIEQLKYHMAFFNGEKIIEQIKKYYPVISINKFLENTDNTDTTFIIIDDVTSLEFKLLNSILMQGRAFNTFLIFNFINKKDILDFVQNEFFTANIHDISYSRELYEMLYGSLEANKIAVKSILKSGSQLEHLV